MSSVTPFTGNTSVDLPVPQVIEAALASDLQDVVILGTGQDGNIYLATSQGDMAAVLWTMETIKMALLQNNG